MRVGSPSTFRVTIVDACILLECLYAICRDYRVRERVDNRSGAVGFHNADKEVPRVTDAMHLNAEALADSDIDRGERYRHTELCLDYSVQKAVIRRMIFDLVAAILQNAANRIGQETCILLR